MHNGQHSYNNSMKNYTNATSRQLQNKIMTSYKRNDLQGRCNQTKQFEAGKLYM